MLKITLNLFLSEAIFSIFLSFLLFFPRKKKEEKEIKEHNGCELLSCIKHVAKAYNFLL